MIKKFAQIIPYEIPEDLKPLVLAFIVGESKEVIDVKIPMYATGFPLLIYISGDFPNLFNYGKRYDYNSRLILAGQIYKAKINFSLKGIFEQVGVILTPSAPFYLFHKSGNQFLNKWTGLTDVAEEQAVRELSNDLSRCTSNDQQIKYFLNFLQNLLHDRLPDVPWLESSLRQIFENNGKIIQTDLIQDSGVSERHFRRIFKKIIGVPPKYFCKVIQLNSVFDMLNNSASEKLHHLALDCGYYDQSHFINDFNRLIGESPENFLNGDHAFIKTYMGRPGV